MPTVDRMETRKTSVHFREPEMTIKIATRTGVLKKNPKRPRTWMYPKIKAARRTTPHLSCQEVFAGTFSRSPRERLFPSNTMDRNVRHAVRTQGMKSLPRVFGRFRSGSFAVRKA